MTKHKKNLVNSNKDQMNLFDILLQEQAERQSLRPGRLNISVQINAAIKNAIRNVPKSRETIADEMTELAGERITVGQINNWTADSHPHEMPGRFDAAFCVVTGDQELVRIKVEAAGSFILPGQDALRAEIQKLDEETRKLQAEKRKRQVFLQELEGRK